MEVAPESPSHEMGPGFDAIVGNPPFGGHVTVVEGNVRHYSDWLRTIHCGTSGKCDVVAHFFRRAFDLIREHGAFGLIATNTVAQGDTRASGLRWICTHGGEVFSVRRRVKWPGLAAVIVSVLHIGKGSVTEMKQIDSRDVERITAFLFHRGGHDDPVRLKANAGKSFQGSIVLGMGFTFDDTDKEGVASPLAEMHRLIELDPHNREVIYPYIGGQEINASSLSDLGPGFIMGLVELRGRSRCRSLYSDTSRSCICCRRTYAIGCRRTIWRTSWLRRWNGCRWSGSR